MIRYALVILLSCSMLTGCSTLSKWFKRERVVIQTIQVDRPVFQCPNKLQTLVIPSRPDLLIYGLTEADKQQPGKVGKAYKGTVLQLLQHIDILESHLGDVNQVCKISESE